MLTPQQQYCVDHDANLLVLAIPGSGKTHTLVEKADNLLRNPKVRIGMVTFTNDATRELRQRLLKAVGEQKFKRVVVETFHKHAIVQMRNAQKLGKVISPNEQKNLVFGAIRSLPEPVPPDEALSMIEAYKSALKRPDEEPHPVVKIYEERLKRSRGVDLIDVVRDAVLGMQSGEIPPLNVTHLLVDEFQDIDHLQFAWILHHAKMGVHTTVVGDDDQSIYGWRNALGYRGMMDFAQATNAEIVTLDRNFRCKAEILQHADRLIRYNKERAEKTLVSVRGPGGSVSLIRPPSVEDEAFDVTKLIAPDLIPAPAGQWYASDVPPGSWAIISRTNVHLWPVECALRAQRIRFSKSVKSTEPPQVSLFLSMLLTVQDGSRLGFELSLQTLDVQEHVAQALYEAAGNDLGLLLDSGTVSLPKVDAEALKPVSTLIGRYGVWRNLVREGRYALVIAGVEQWIVENYPLRNKVRDVNDLHAAADMIARMHGSLSQRVHLFQAPKDDKNEDKGGVQLLTMHSAKGLEFDKVAVIQVIDGTCPSANAGNVDEERRLMYVAITRARDHLYVSSVASRPASPFIVEAGIESQELKPPHSLP